jgi:hypothetical protein
VDPLYFENIQTGNIITNMEDTTVYPENNGAHPSLLSKINAGEADRFYSGKQHDNLFSFGKRESPIHCEIIDIKKPLIEGV